MRKNIVLIIVVAALAGCAQLGSLAQNPQADTTRPVLRPGSDANAPPANARTPEQFDTTTDEERAAALAPAKTSTGKLGQTIASLGDPTKPGFWLETPLVKAPRQGRVVFTPTGKAVSVELIPIDGPKTGGSRISLAAMRLLGLSLTDLPELVVYGE